MEFRLFGSSGRQVSVIGQGTWYIDRGDRAQAIAALRLGIDRGMIHIDTAEMYGAAEEIVGEAIAGRRDDVFLVSKVLPQNASRSGTIAACERSLARLRTSGWIAIFCTGAAATHWKAQSRLSMSLKAKARFSRGA